MEQLLIYAFFPIYVLFWLIIYAYVGLLVYQRWIRQEIIYLIQMLKVTIDVFQKKDSNAKKSDDIPSNMDIERSMDLMLIPKTEDGKQKNNMEEEEKNNDGDASLDWEQIDI